MKKIVDRPEKIDLHIHSVFSTAKDHDKVKDNTLSNVPILIKKLNENDVNICAITDHDKFNFDLYNTLKKEENNGSILKVLPGVEFTVTFNIESSTNVDSSKPVHVITIFNDNDETKLKKLEELLGSDFKTLKYEPEDSFSEEEYLEILKKVDLDTVMIAHQKNRLDSRATSKPRANDANNSGKEVFDFFLMTNYFEAFEFRNKKYEVFMNGFTVENDYQEVFRTITSSDCHSWKVYPNIDENNCNDSFAYTFLKCLPTFRGVVMAITDHRRIKKVDSFFSPSEKFCENLVIEIDGRNECIPLSRGLNVIIGDNSIGKSLLLHKITNFQKDGICLTKTLKENYENYLEKNNCKITTNIEKQNIYMFDMQGEVREKFENKKLKGTDFLEQYFPKDIEIGNYKKTIFDEIDRYCDSLTFRKDYNTLLDSLSKFTIKEMSCMSSSIVFINPLEVNQTESNGLEKLVEKMKTIESLLDDLENNKFLEDKDVKEFKLISQKIENVRFKYKKLLTHEKNNIKCKNIITTVVNEKYTKLASINSDIQKKLDKYIKDKDLISTNIINLIKAEILLFKYEPNVRKEIIVPNSIQIYHYKFITKLENVKEISNEFIISLIKSIFRSNTILDVINPRHIDEGLKTAINGTLDGVNLIYEIREKIKENALKYLKNDNGIIDEKEKDLYRELSSGFNSKTYFDLIAYDECNEGIYIIDQPEDNVSQKAIKSYILERFKTMSNNRQIIFVTHNPQFIINLDVDNVIFLGKKDESLIIQSGALEYYDEDYNILNIVAENIDGGIDTIKKRWKRYEKNINF